MRLITTPIDEAFYSVRSLSVDYSAGGSEPSHTHQWPQLLYSKRGALKVKLAESIWIIPPRRALWVPAQTEHSLFMSSDLELRTLYFRPDPLIVNLSRRAINVSGLLHEAILRVCQQHRLDDRSEADRCIYGVILNELKGSSATGYNLVMPIDDRAKKAAKKMLAADSDLKDALTYAGLTRRTAERIFAKQTGMSPAQWLRMSRLTQSMIALASGEPINKVSHDAGYQSRSAFSQAYKSVFGIPPGESCQN